MSFTQPEPATPRLTRSELAVPGVNPALFEKAAKSAADVIFACTLDDGAKVSVCRNGQSAQYREQPADGSAALVLPQGDGGAWDWAHVMYSGGGETQVRFANGGANDVVVYSRMVRTRFDGEGNEPEITDGVMVPRGDPARSQRLCDEGAEISPLDLNALEAIKAGGQDLFVIVEDL